MGLERISEVATRARLVENCGFSHLSFLDTGNVAREVNVMMTIAALNTSRIHIGHGVTEPFTYHPLAIANTAATLRELTGGRAFVGIGAGLPWGKPGTKLAPLRELREAVQFIRQYTTGEEAELKERRVHSEWIRHSEWAGQSIPIHMACGGPRSCELAGELADAVLFHGVDPDIVRWRLQRIQRGASKAGRDPSQVQVWVRTLICVAGSWKEARREAAAYAADLAVASFKLIFSRDTPDTLELRERLERTRPGLADDCKRVWERADPYKFGARDTPQAELVTQQLIDAFLLTGPASDIRAQIQELRELGVTGISCVLFGLIQPEDMMRKISDSVMSHFQ